LWKRVVYVRERERERERANLHYQAIAITRAFYIGIITFAESPKLEYFK